MPKLTHIRGGFVDSDISGAWLDSAHLSRKGNFISQAYQSMLNAARLKDRSATIEHARLLWKDGHHRKAIQTLESAISANEISLNSAASVDSDAASFLSGRGQTQNDVTARVSLQELCMHCLERKLSIFRPISCWQNGRTEPVKPTLRPLFNDIGKPSSSIQGGSNF